MAEIAQVLATYDALAGVAIGAGLTYWFGALNRRHQEAREDRTRWHEARFNAYADFYGTVSDVWFTATQGQPTYEDRQKLSTRLYAALSRVLLVGSLEAVRAATTVAEETSEESAKAAKFDEERVTPFVHQFLDAARKDLGHPVPPGESMRSPERGAG
jgi:hypothetical protein